jgi:hypothetical protein
MTSIKLADFERIYLLALDERRNQWSRIDREFAARGAKVTRFIVGKGNIFPANGYAVIDPTEMPAGTPWVNGTFNAYCCHMAHRSILSRCQKDKLANVLLLEDDCQLLENFDQVVESATTQMKELGVVWDTFTFGQNVSFGDATQLASNLLKLNSGVYCWHAIAINQEHHDMFQHFLDLPVAGPFDWLWSLHTQPKYNCLGVWPSVAIQKPGISYVLGAPQDYTGYLKDKGKNVIY